MTRLDLVDGQRVTWDAALGRGGTIHGVVVDARGAPLEGLVVDLFGGTGAHPPPPPVTTGRDGSFSIEGAEDVDYRLLVMDASRTSNRAAVELPGVRPGAAPLHIVVPDGRLPSARFTGCALSPNGEPLTDVRLDATRLRDDGSMEIAFQKMEVDGGRFVTPLLRPGRYSVHIQSKAHGTLRLGEWTLASGTTVDLGTHRFPLVGTLEIEIVGADGNRLRAGRVLCRHKADPMAFVTHLQNGAGRLSLQPGRYLVSTSGTLPMAAAMIEVEAGHTTALRLEVPYGVKRQLRYPPITVDRYHLEITWRDAQGRIVYLDGGSNDRRTTRIVVTRLIPPGSYTVEVRDASGASATTEVVVEDRESDEVIDLPSPR